MADEYDFEPRLGRQRARGARQARKYLGRVLAATNLARGGARRLGTGSGAYKGSRYGKGAGIGRMLASHGSRGGLRSRRVVIKARIVRLAGKGVDAAAAHLRYLQRDGTTRDGDAGMLYGRDSDVVDRAQFHARGAGDRHQFRFIVSAEDGADYDDLKPLTRRLMDQVEQDLGTRLDWVAVDHFNTGHPHSHIVVRGKDDRGADLVLAKDYLTVGMRERAREIVALDLGPRTELDIEASLRAEVTHERYTSLDRTLLRELADDRTVSAAARGALEQTLRAGRLAKLTKLGLAEPVGGGRWRLADDLEDTLRRMGERGEIIRTMQREMSRAGVGRAASDRVIFSPGAADAVPLVGRVVTRGLEDEHADRHYLIVDGLDGRAHYVPLGRGDNVEPLAPGMVVEVTPMRAVVREADHTIVAVAATNGGRYDVDAHLGHDPSATQDFAESHVRRLEAMRRGRGGVERDAAGTWTIADDHLERVERWQTNNLRGRPVAVEILSREPVHRLVEMDAATWLDRVNAGGVIDTARDAGFGREMRKAAAQRQQWLLRADLADEVGGAIRNRPDTLAALQRREVQRVAGQLAAELGKPFAKAPVGTPIEGVLRKQIDIVSGRFALIERSRDFMLVPWRPVLKQRIGSAVSGIVRETGVSWTIGRGRGGPSIG